MNFNQDKAVGTIIQYFLRTLMKLERKRYGWSTKEAASKAKWPLECWQSLETYQLGIEIHHWINVSAVLNLTDDRLARRLDAFVNKNPVIIVSVDDFDNVQVFEKTVTSPKLIQNQNIFTQNLPSLRIKLFNNLSQYTPDADTFIETVKARAFYKNMENMPLKPSFPRPNTAEKIEQHRNRLNRLIVEKIADNKLDALEKTLELIAASQATELNRAVQIFEIVLK